MMTFTRQNVHQPIKRRPMRGGKSDAGGPEKQFYLYGSINIITDSKASEKLSALLMNAKFSKDIARVFLPDIIRGIFYSVIIHFAPKLTAFLTRECSAGNTPLISAKQYINTNSHVWCLTLHLTLTIQFCTFWLQLAALHFNENANRQQAVTESGEERYYDTVFTKYEKGGYVCEKLSKIQHTVGYWIIIITHILVTITCTAIVFFIGYIDKLVERTVAVCCRTGSSPR